MGASTGRALFDAAAAGGAQALARDSGRLAAGAVADVVSLDRESPYFAGREDDQILDAWIFAAGNRAVDCVWSGGRKVVSGGRHFARDAVAERFVAAARALAAR